ncbi:MAG: farnesyl diphosphate synthase, partial [Natronospirillum sp.]
PASHQRLQQALEYALLAAGKRTRPLLSFAAARAMGQTTDGWLIPAQAVEMIHTYSLIHDDLPAMDDDQWRRGRPTTHIAFSEATAILAGDALQCMAFQVLAESDPLGASAPQRLSWVRQLAIASGQLGMVDGQAIDCDAQGQIDTLAALETMHRKKTGALIGAAVLMGAGSAEHPPNESEQAALTQYADALGLAFQVMDDVLDVTADTATLGKDAGSDAAANKVTYVSLMGMAAAQARTRELHEEALAALVHLPGKVYALQAIADFIIARAK